MTAAGRFAAAVLAVSTAAGCAIVDVEQRRWLFNTTTAAWAEAASAAEGLQDVWIDHVPADPDQPGARVRLHGLWLPQPDDADAPVLLFLHGVRWDVRASAPRMRRLHALGFSVLGIDYRGFGRSSAALPSEAMVAEDARAAWRWLAAMHPRSRRYLAGHSLGSAVAVRLAAEVDDESGVIVEGGFTSTADVLRSTRWGWLPVVPLITQRFDAASRVADIGSPLLVVHGSDDTMVAPRVGRALYDRALPPKRWLLVPDAVHENADIVGQALLQQAVRDMFGIGPAPAGVDIAPGR